MNSFPSDRIDPPHAPPAGPLVEPAEAIAIGLSMVPSMGKRLLSPEGPEVTLRPNYPHHPNSGETVVLHDDR